MAEIWNYTMTESVTTLNRLRKGQRATVVDLKSRGLERRRLMDLGILPGTEIRVEMGNPLGDPNAYQVRGSVIALRNSQAQNIEITLQEENR
jgi:ferrous iron transport protein A